MAITYFGSASTPLDGSATTNVTNPTVVTPPASMVTGDLVVLIASARQSTVTPAMSQAGGQTWTSEALFNTTVTNLSARLFWCRYNGTWSANPSVLLNSTLCNIVTMHVFRPTVGTNIWSVDVVFETLNFAASTAPIPIPSRNTVADNTVSVASWITPDDNTWGTLSGTGWTVLGSAQYRNTSGTDSSQTHAYNIKTSAGATNIVNKTQLTLGGDAGVYGIITFKEGIAGTTYESNISETVTFSDTVNRGYVGNATVNETVSFLDTSTREYTGNAVVSETVTFTDTQTRQYTGEAVISEAVTFLDTTAAGRTIEAAILETLDMTDQPTRFAAYQALLAELLTLADVVSATAQLSASINETVTFTDLVNRGIEVLRNIQENVTFADTYTSLITLDRLQAEIVQFIDNVNANASMGTQVVETVTFTDLVMVQASMQVAVSEFITLVDTVTGVVMIPLFSSLAEMFTIVDLYTAIKTVGNYFKNYTDLNPGGMYGIKSKGTPGNIEGEPGTTGINDDNKPTFLI